VSRVLDAIDAGFYAQKQLGSRSRLISWTHRGRFEMGLALARHAAGRRVLDYGSGDGTFLALLAGGRGAPAVAVGAELQDSVVEDCRTRFSAVDRLHFVRVCDLDDGEYDGAFDMVFCMEVLEHVLEPLDSLRRMNRLLAPGGRIVISVPIEIGLPVLAKQAVRRLAGWRGIGHYPGTSGYSLPEMVRSVFAGSRQHVTRPVFRSPDGMPFHDHKGFNWRRLRTELQELFDVRRETTSPVPWLGPQCGTQRWFVAEKRRS